MLKVGDIVVCSETSAIFPLKSGNVFVILVGSDNNVRPRHVIIGNLLTLQPITWAVGGSVWFSDTRFELADQENKENVVV